MKFGKLIFCALAVIMTAASLFAQTPEINIDATTRKNIAISPLGSSEATSILENDLRRSGIFNIVSAADAEYIAQGQPGGAGLQGTLNQKSGGNCFSKSFSGDIRLATHLFADEIVRFVTGKPGISSTKVAFISKQTGSKEVYTMDIDGSNVRQITNDKVISLGPKYSYNGAKIAYTSYLKHYPDVWVIDLASKQRNRIAFFPGLNSCPAFSPDGSKLAVTLSKDGNTELYLINSTGGSPDRLTRTRGTEASPTWSPDGSQIAYVCDERGQPQIWTISSSGSNPHRLDRTPSYATEPDWSPDGEKIAYTISSAGQHHIGYTNLRTGKQEVLTSEGNNESPSWARDSRHLIYSRSGKLYLLDSLTKQSIEINNGLTGNTEPNCTR